MIGGRSALLSAAGGNLGYGNWTGDYEDVSLLLRNGFPLLAPIDESSTPKTVTTLGDAGFITNFLKYGSSSLRLEKSPDALSIPKLGLISTDFTIEFWIYLLDGGVADQVVCATYNAPTQLNTFFVSRSSPGNIITFLDPFGVGSTSTALPLATWTHIACVYIHSTRNYRIFVNGIGSTSATGTAITAEAANFFIGGSPGDNNIGTRYLSALIDDFRVTKLARYTSNFTPPSAELPANISDDPSYSSVPLLIRNGNPLSGIRLEIRDESPAPKQLNLYPPIGISETTWKYSGSSLAFSGGHIRMNGEQDFAFGIGDFTIEFWINFSTIRSADYGSFILDQRLINSDQFQISAHLTLGFIYRRTESMYSNTPLSLNTWYHFALAREASITRMFVNGGLKASAPDTLNVQNSGNRPIIGGDIDGPGNRTFTGYIDDLRITKGVARYTKNFLPPPAELPAI